MPTQPLDRKTVLDVDPWLEPQVDAIIHRHDLFRKWKDTIEEHEGGYDAFTKGYEKFGLVVQKDNSVIYREWAPNAKEAVLTGDFSTCLTCLRVVATDGCVRQMEPHLTPNDQE